MMPFPSWLRPAGLVITFTVGVAPEAIAQAPPLVFTATVPQQRPAEPTPQASVVVEDRGLALWAGTASDFGKGAAISNPQWTLRSITSLTTLPTSGRDRPAFQQVELVRPIASFGSMSLAGGGGIRQEWDGTQVLIGRVLMGADVEPRTATGELRARASRFRGVVPPRRGGYRDEPRLVATD